VLFERPTVGELGDAIKEAIVLELEGSETR